MRLKHGDHISLFGEKQECSGFLGIVDQFTTTIDSACMKKQPLLYESSEEQCPLNFYQNCVFQIDLSEHASKDTPIRYGWSINLRHVLSGYFLSTTTELSSGSNFMLTLKRDPDIYCSFSLEASFKMRTSGEFVVYGDTICLLSKVTQQFVSFLKMD